MNGFTRYVMRQLFVAMIFVTAGLTCIIWLFYSLRFVEMIVNRGVSVGVFAYMTMLTLPSFLTLILPIALFCVVVFVYAKLISDRELVVMRAAGMSQVALAKPAVILALLIVGFGYLLNLYLVPNSYRMFRELQWNVRYNYSHVLLKEGAFSNVTPGITVYVRERTKDGQLLGILAYDERQKDQPVTLMAAKGAMVESDGGARVVMFNGNRQLVEKDTNKLSILYFDQYTFDLGKTRGTTLTRYREARERSLDELLNAEDAVNLNVSPNDVGKFYVEAHKRLVSPMLSLGLTLIALACLISGPFSRRTQTRQITLSIIIMVALHGTTIGLESTVAKRLELVPLMYVHALLPIILALYFVVRLPRFSANGGRAQAG